MPAKLSPRLEAIVDALPLRPGCRVLEIGCGTGVAAAEVARRIKVGHVLGIDRSAKAIAQSRSQDFEAMASGSLEFRQAAAEAFQLREGEQPYDFAFAVRVGALDGRHPDLEGAAKACIRAALVPGGKLFTDGGAPLKVVSLDPEP